MNAYEIGFRALESDGQRLSWVFSLLTDLVTTYDNMSKEPARVFHREWMDMSMGRARDICKSLRSDMHRHDVVIDPQTGDQYCKQCECLV